MRDRNQLYDIETLDLDLANTTDAQVDAWLSHLSVMLNPLGKERFFSGMAAVTLADGAIDETERAMLEHVGHGLLLTPGQPWLARSHSAAIGDLVVTYPFQNSARLKSAGGVNS